MTKVSSCLPVVVVVVVAVDEWLLWLNRSATIMIMDDGHAGCFQSKP